jgi:2-oxo-4-hydroxy-4-carboxy-5-ureidoimidazoline decarboxylase
VTLAELNNLEAAQASQLFFDCNAASRWVDAMVAGRPYSSLEALKAKARQIWSSLGESDYLEAFEAHPMIGDVDSLREKYGSTKAIAAGEQAGAATADEETLQRLARLNQEYLGKFGFIFIVFATGKSAAEMLALLESRIGNTREQEVQNAAAEQLKITLLRIDKLIPAD